MTSITRATDRQRLWMHYYDAACAGVNPPSFTELCTAADNELFKRVINNIASTQVMHGFLPPMTVASQNCNLRRRKHSL